MSHKIPATVVTGFLGAGKTTLIRHLLENSGSKRIALIINEFGDLGVDGSILEGCGASGCDDGRIVELSNGCICCAVADEFAPAIQSLLTLSEPPDHIVIETSGLALPQPLVRAFNWPELRARVTVDGVVALIDGPAVRIGQFAHDIDAVDKQRQADENLDHESPLAELFEDQLACADLVIVNKRDLMKYSDLELTMKELKARARMGASVLSAEKGIISPQVVLGIEAAAESEMTFRSEIHHRHDDNAFEASAEAEHGHDEFESFVVNLPETKDKRSLIAGIQETIKRHGLLRIKGFSAVAGKPMRLVIQAVGPRIDHYFDKPFEAEIERTTRLVAIGLEGIDRAAVTRELKTASGN